MNPPQYAGHPDATVGVRCGAFLIDLLVMLAVGWIPFFGWVVAPVYLITRDALPFLDGQSLGKRVMGLRAVDDRGAALTANYGASVLRNVLLIIPIMPIVEIVVVLTDPERRRLGDKWARTRVVATS